MILLSHLCQNLICYLLKSNLTNSRSKVDFISINSDWTWFFYCDFVFFNLTTASITVSRRLDLAFNEVIFVSTCKPSHPPPCNSLLQHSWHGWTPALSSSAPSMPPSHKWWYCHPYGHQYVIITYQYMILRTNDFGENQH